MTSRPSPDTPCAGCGHLWHDGRCGVPITDRTVRSGCPCTKHVAPATHDPESEPRHHPFAKDQEGVRCKRCHRWHSGFTDADAPTDLCEDCAAAPDTAPHVHECAILAHDCSALSPYCRCVCGAEFLWDEWTMPNEWTVTRLYSALENYGRHHNWCAWKKGEICDCGLSDILNERERGPKANARLPEGSPRGVRNPVESRAEKTAVLSPVAPDTAPHEHVCDEGRNNHSGRCTCGCGAKLIGETWSPPSTEPAVSGEAPRPRDWQDLNRVEYPNPAFTAAPPVEGAQDWEEDIEGAIDDLLYEWNAYNEKISSAVREGQKNPTNQNPQKYEDARKALLEMIPRCEKWGAQALAFWEMFANNERLTAELSRLRAENKRTQRDHGYALATVQERHGELLAAAEKVLGVWDSLDAVPSSEPARPHKERMDAAIETLRREVQP